MMRVNEQIINHLTKIDMTKSENVNLVLGREEAYKASPRIWSFKYTDDIVNGLNLNLSNMVSAYPFNAHIHIFGKPLQIS